MKYVKTSKNDYQNLVRDGCVILELKCDFDGGIIGYRPDLNRLVYDIDLLIDSLMDAWNVDYQTASDFVYYNTIPMKDLIENYPDFTTYTDNIDD